MVRNNEKESIILAFYNCFFAFSSHASCVQIKEIYFSICVLFVSVCNLLFILDFNETEIPLIISLCPEALFGVLYITLN